MIADPSPRELALSIARCPEVPLARSDRAHPCSTIVSSQGSLPDDWQVPEAWAGSLATAKILFLSSNPSIGQPQQGVPDRVEVYPTSSWPDEAVADFLVDRFGPWVTAEDRYLMRDGSYSAPVQFWSRVRKRAAEILGQPADPRSDYAMTEVVHCKSRAEQGVGQAVDLCASLHLERVIAACPARLVVVLGAKARDQVRQLWNLPPEFGRGERPGREEDHMMLVELGGRERLVIHLPHPTGMEANRRVPEAFPSCLGEIRRWATSETETGPRTHRPTLHPEVTSTRTTVTPNNRRPSVQDQDVVIVAAGNAWPFYRLTSAYVCQAGRTFRGVDHLGFYSQKTIHGVVTQIEHVVDDIVLTQAEAARRALSVDPMDRRIGDVMTAAMAGAWKEGESSQILLLSSLDAPGSTPFAPITHSGRSAWTMGQRYTTLNALLRARTTDGLSGGAE